MVFGFGKKDKKKEKPEVTASSGAAFIPGLLNKEGGNEVFVLPPGIEEKDAGKWKKLLEYIETHPLFQITTFDGLYWVDPFKAELISAPFDLPKTVRDHLAANHHWMTSKLKPAVQLHTVKWIQYLGENLDSDKRFALFQSNGSWYNPWTKRPCPKITLELYNKRKAFIKAVAAEMAQSEDANPREMLSLAHLEQIMQGMLDAEQAKREEEERRAARSGKSNVGSIRAMDEVVQEEQQRAHQSGAHTAVTGSHSGPKAAAAETGAVGVAPGPVLDDGEPVIEADGDFGNLSNEEVARFKAGVAQGQAGARGHGGKAPSNEEIWASLKQINERLASQGQAPVALPAGMPVGGVATGTVATAAASPDPAAIQQLVASLAQANQQLAAAGRETVPPPQPSPGGDIDWEELVNGMRRANDQLSQTGQAPFPLPGGVPVAPAPGAPPPDAAAVQQLLQSFAMANSQLSATGQPPVPTPAPLPGQASPGWEQLLGSLVQANQQLATTGGAPVAVPGGLPVVPAPMAAGGAPGYAAATGPSAEELMRSVQQANERLTAQGQAPVHLPTIAPGAGAPSYAELWQSLQMINQRLAMSGPMVVPSSPVVFPAAQQLFNGLISLRGDAPREDEEDDEADGEGEAHHIPGNVPVMSQQDLSPELIQQLVDSLRQVSLVASNVSAYDPGSRRAAGSSRALTRKKGPQDESGEFSDLNPFEEADREADDEEGVPQVRTDAFLEGEANLDIDRAFARLQARKARGDDAEPEAGEDAGVGAGAVGGDFSFDVDEDAEGDVGDDLLSDEDEEEYDDHAQDMEKAVNVQNHLLGGIPQLDDVEIALHYVPLADIGGDFYNVIKLNDDRFFFIVGDVAGHGVQAALIVSSIVNTLRIIFRNRETFELMDIVSDLNDYMRDCLMTGQFFTAFCGIITTGRRPVLECICAGHHPSVCLNKTHEEPIREVGKLGMGIGLVRSKTFRQKTEVATYELVPGDTICIYTDGIVEVMDENDEELGDAFARSSFFSHMDQPIGEMIESVLGDIHAEMVGEIMDDQTVMVIKILPPDEGKEDTDDQDGSGATKEPETYGPGEAPSGHEDTRAALTGEVSADGDGVVVSADEFQTDIPAVRLGPDAVVEAPTPIEPDLEPTDAPDGVITPEPAAPPDTDIVFDVDGLGATGMVDEDDEL